MMNYTKTEDTMRCAPMPVETESVSFATKTMNTYKALCEIDDILDKMATFMLGSCNKEPEREAPTCFFEGIDTNFNMAEMLKDRVASMASMFGVK